nr:MAG TPA: Transcription factor HY5 leucine zipper, TRANSCRIPTION.0A [Caudoviricetes sp.]
MTTKDRLKEFLSSQKIGRNKFEEQINISTGYMSSKAITVTSDVIEKTVSAYPDLNIEWLITGRGSMLKSESPIHESKPFDNNLAQIEELKSEIIALKAENKVLRELVGLGERKDNKSA